MQMQIQLQLYFQTDTSAWLNKHRKLAIVETNFRL
jgi:hypothetical protein